MTFHARLLTLLACASVAAGSFAQGCEGNRYKAEMTLAALPADVSMAMLRAGRIADRGEKFQATDVILDANPPPFRRFSIAAVSDHRIVAAIQVGGGPNYTELWSFDRAGDQWKGGGSRAVPKAPVVETPATLPELLYWICAGYPEPPPPPLEASVPVL
jgi:hypothetical protein